MFEFNSEADHWVDGPAGRLQAVATPANKQGPLAKAAAVVIICHPHPLHGGTMDNKVVTTMMRAYRDLGVHVVRFNFRGVGKSEGEHDHGQGELEDLLAMARAVEASNPKAPLLLAGFSFGSAIAAQASYRLNCRHLSLIAPPVTRYDFDQGGAFPVPLSVLQGDSDERIGAAEVSTWVAGLGSEADIKVFADTGHFFHGALSDLKQVLMEMIVRQWREVDVCE